VKGIFGWMEEKGRKRRLKGKRGRGEGRKGKRRKRTGGERGDGSKGKNMRVLEEGDAAEGEGVEEEVAPQLPHSPLALSSLLPVVGCFVSSRRK